MMNDDGGMGNMGSDRDGGRWLALAALFGAALLWSLGGPLVKLLAGADPRVEAVGGWSVAFWRSMFGGMCFLPFAWPRRRSLGRVHPVWLMAAVVAFTVMTACYVLATMSTAAANAIILQYTSPIWVFLLSPMLLKERPSLAEAGVLILAMVGVVVIFAAGEPGHMRGMIIALVSGLGYGALTVLLRAVRQVDPAVLVCMNCLGSAVLMLPVVWWGAGMPGSAVQWILVALLGTVQVALPYVLFSYALQRIEAHRAALVLLIETVLNPVLTYLVVGERVPMGTLWGGPLILLSVGLWLGWSARAEVPVGGEGVAMEVDED